MVARELQKLFVRAQRDAHEHEHGRHGHEVLERHNEENAVGTLPFCFGERLGMVTMVGASREARRTSGATTAAYATMHSTTVDPSTADHCWCLFLNVNLVMVIVFVFYKKGHDHPKVQQVGTST